MSDDARSLEAERRRAQRLEVASRMARGIGRELVDLVTVIRGHASLLVDGAGPDARPSADAIERATTHAAELARRLLVLGGDGVLTPRRTRLDRLIGDLSIPLADAAGAAHLDLRLDPATPEVTVDGQQLGRTIADLVASGVARGGRHVTIAVHPGTRATDGRSRAIVEIRDDGPAIPVAEVEHWSEPFADDDAGLARASFHGIVVQSGGAASLASSPGATVFLASLPALAEPADVRPAEQPPLGHGTESVLIVEDEDDVRSFLTRALKRAGYEVTDVASAEEAMAASGEYFGPPIELLVADVVLPGMTGPELARRLQADRPELPVLFVSGQASDLTAFHGLSGLADQVLAKPFDAETLVRRVRTMLDARSSQVNGRQPDR
jgi:two-component system cell cycle sensor histidine kinase/response regulator CckA